MIVFAHVSDTHFGEVLANTANGTVMHQDPHGLPQCLNLYTTLLNVQAAMGMPSGLPLPIVHSGDLTLCGANAEFAVGQAFLRSRFRIRLARAGGFMGLAVADDQLAMVPGNHDHWDGLRGRWNYAKGVPGFTASIQGSQFEKTPWRIAWNDQSDENERRLELFGVDSSSGLGPGSKSWLAKGSISAAEFSALEALLQRQHQHRRPAVRVVVCHHSLAFQAGFWGGGAWRNGELDANSRDELIRLCGRYGVTAVLTGHTHDFVHKEFFTADAKGDPWTVHELRCASTLALNQPHNGFWVHKIAIGPSGQRIWSAWRYSWQGSRFISKPQPDVKFTVP